MNWIETEYEIAMKSYFISKMGKIRGNELYTDYESLRNELIKDNFFNEIKGVEPSLSDHSDRHIKDVLDRAFKLIGDFKGQGLSVYDVYCLALMILFHDVGNIFGRKGHASVYKIAEVYNQYRANFSNYSEERRQVSIGASAHSGLSKNDCEDTLKFIEKGRIRGEEINLPELAAILRFADELAEGKQRTCSFLIDHHLYDSKSEIFQQYAKITEIRIDRGLGRISIDYSINISKVFDDEEQTRLKDLIRFTYYRAVKLDQERRYTKYYSDVLKQFKYVTVLYQFDINNIPIQLDLEPIRFEDQYPIPGIGFVSDRDDAEKIILKKSDRFKIDKIIELLKNRIEE